MTEEMEAFIFRLIAVTVLGLLAWVGYCFAGPAGASIGFAVMYIGAGAMCSLSICSNGDAWATAKSRAKIFLFWLPGIFSRRIHNWLTWEDLG